MMVKRGWNLITESISLEQFWDRICEIWDGLPEILLQVKNFRNSEEDFIISLIRNNKNSIILDLGCGTGRMLKELSSIGANRLYGIDISSKMIDRCRSSLPEWVILLQHDFRERLPFTCNFFDFILITGNTLTSSVTNSGLVLKQAYRVLKDGGILIAGIYNAEHMSEDFVKKYYGKFPEPIDLKDFDKDANSVLIGDIVSHWVTENELRQLLENQNFKMIEIKRSGIGFIAVAKK